VHVCVEYYLSLIPTVTFASLRKRSEETVVRIQWVQVKEEVTQTTGCWGGERVFTFAPFTPLVPFLPPAPWREAKPNRQDTWGETEVVEGRHYIKYNLIVLFYWPQWWKVTKYIYSCTHVRIWCFTWVYFLLLYTLLVPRGKFTKWSNVNKLLH